MYTGAWYHLSLIARDNNLKYLAVFCLYCLAVMLVSLLPFTRLSNDLAMRTIEKWQEQRDKVCSFLSFQEPCTGPNAMFGGRYFGLLWSPPAILDQKSVDVLYTFDYRYEHQVTSVRRFSLF